MTPHFAVPQPLDQIAKSELSAILKGVEAVFQYWVNLSPRYMGLPAEGPAPLPLEVSIRFSHPSPVFVNIRTSTELAQVLIHSLRGRILFPFSERAMFEEFANLLGDNLMVFLCGNDRRPFRVPEQYFSGPQNWPKGEPTAAGAFLVEKFPIEIRVWSESKIEAWR